jgi:isoleucyl-tRNA synthetase
MAKPSLQQLADDTAYTLHDEVVGKMWEKMDIYTKKSEICKTRSKKQAIMDGPPFPTGKLHLGHFAIGVIKRTIEQFWFMTGYDTTYQAGFDCHGLPIENIVSTMLGLKTGDDIRAYGIDKFNDECKKKINDCSDSWKPVFEKIGRHVNFTTAYKTMDTSFMETVWWIFKTLWEKKLVYKGFKVSPYSFGCQTVLSNFESSQNYKEKTTASVYVLFKNLELDNTYFVVWTTTPWTLPSNVSMCVNSELNYSYCKDDKDRTLIIGTDSVPNLRKLGIKLEIYKTVKGSVLVGMVYEPLFSYTKGKCNYRVLSDPYVTNGDIGTSIVHIAPAHGDDDYRICFANGIVDTKTIGDFCFVDDNGNFTDIVVEFKGQNVFESDPKVIEHLKSRGLILRIQEYKHQYPYCWRTDTPLIYRAVESWYVRVEDIKEKMIQLNKTINWHPREIGANRFNNWIESATDWCVSRSRFFGTPIPVWESEDGTETICIGSIGELQIIAKLDYTPKDIHPETVSKIEFISPSGKLMKCVPYVFDCWFESGSVPFGKIHYPFENRELIDNDNPYLSDFVVEGLDQTRGWFYTLLVISTAICGKAPFKTVMCSGLILDETGHKFSKKLQNYVDTEKLIEIYSTDVLGMYVLSSHLINAEPLKFKEDDVRKFKERVLPYVNGVKFFIEHTKNFIHRGSEFSLDAYKTSTNFFDLWIIEKVKILANDVHKMMSNYQINKAIMATVEFIEDLTNWYIKFNRDRLRGINGDEQWNASLSTLYYVLMTYVKIAVLSMPFLSEYVYEHLKVLSTDVKESLLLESYPTFEITTEYNDTMNLLKDIVKSVRYFRKTSDTHSSVKIPINECIICHNSEDYLNKLKELIVTVEDELNCLTYTYTTLSDNLQINIEPNRKNIGSKYKKLAPRIITVLKEYVEYVNNNKVNITDTIVLTIDSETITLDSTDYTVLQIPTSKIDDKFHVVQSNELMIMCDKTINNRILNINSSKIFAAEIQQMRKRCGLRPWNSIKIHYSDPVNNNIVIQFVTEFNEFLFKKLSCGFVNDDFKNDTEHFTYVVSVKYNDVMLDITVCIEMI